MSEIEPSARVLPAPAGLHAEWSPADFQISTETADALDAAGSANTKDAYTRNWHRFLEWCAASGRVPLPATPHTLTEYISTLIALGRSPNTISQVIGTIRSQHRYAGYKGQPDTEKTLKLLREYKHTWADAGNRVRKASPLTVPQLRALVATCPADKVAGVRDRALLLLGFNIMRRASELARIEIGELDNAGDDGLDVYIRYSKTDKDVTGELVNVPYGQYAGTCAVRAVHAWIQTLAEHGISGGPLLRRVDRHGRIVGEQTPDGAAGSAGMGGEQGLSRHSVTAILRGHALATGDPEIIEDLAKLSGHSLRAGGATAAHNAGAPSGAIAVQGGWSPTSPVMLGYFRVADQRKNNPMKGVGL